jgi:hypothetical protein
MYNKSFLILHHPVAGPSLVSQNVSVPIKRLCKVSSSIISSTDPC